MGDEVASVRITILGQRSFMRAEISRGRARTEVYELLQGVCGESKADPSTRGLIKSQGSIKDKELSGRPKTCTDNTLPKTCTDNTLPKICTDNTLPKTCTTHW